MNIWHLGWPLVLIEGSHPHAPYHHLLQDLNQVILGNKARHRIRTLKNRVAEHRKEIAHLVGRIALDNAFAKAMNPNPEVATHSDSD
jgi:hypothetical protein